MLNKQFSSSYFLFDVELLMIGLLISTTLFCGCNNIENTRNPYNNHHAPNVSRQQQPQKQEPKQQEATMTAIGQLQEKAGQGDVHAQYTLGCKFLHGEGVNKDEIKAKEWFQKAADQGHREALFLLGTINFSSPCGRVDEAAAAENFKEAVKKGHIEAKLWLGNMYLNGQGVIKNTTEGLKLLLEAANAGDIRAQAFLGDLYLNGSHGVEKNEEEAQKWHSKVVK
eukprot:gene184-245_t